MATIARNIRSGNWMPILVVIAVALSGLALYFVLSDRDSNSSATVNSPPSKIEDVESKRFTDSPTLPGGSIYEAETEAAIAAVSQSQIDEMLEGVTLEKGERVEIKENEGYAAWNQNRRTERSLSLIGIDTKGRERRLRSIHMIKVDGKWHWEMELMRVQ